MKIPVLSLFLLTTAVLFVTGCSNTPFAPIAVPKGTAMRPAPKRENVAKERLELKQLQKAGIPDYRIMPGDVFAFVIPNREDLSRDSIKVMADGSISIAPIGHVKVSGLTIPQASGLLTEKYKQYIREIEVVLEPISTRKPTVTVVGAVGKPGIYPIFLGSTRISDAMALAGGVLSTTTDEKEPLQLSDLEKAYIVRNGKILPVNFNKVMTKGDWLHNIPVMDNDYIYVPSLENARVTILGEVKIPSSVIYQPEMTVLQAIGKVGGLKDTKSEDIKIIRGGLKNPVVYHLNVQDMQMGKLADFALEPSDIVFVPKKAISKWNVMVRDLMFSIQMLNTLAGPFGSPAQFYD